MPNETNNPRDGVQPIDVDKPAGEKSKANPDFKPGQEVPEKPQSDLPGGVDDGHYTR